MPWVTGAIKCDMPRAGKGRSDKATCLEPNPFGEENDHLQPPPAPVLAPTLSTDDEREGAPTASATSRSLYLKTGFCCSREEYLHSGDDAEI